MPALQQRYKTHSGRWASLPGPGLALGLAMAAPLVAWGAHGLLGLQLNPGLPPVGAAGLPGGVLGWAWVLVLAPLLEEFVMRTLLQTGLQQQLDRIAAASLNTYLEWRGHAANAATALAFAALHMPENGVLALWWLVPALAIGEVWRRSASWPLCVLLHAWFNASLAAVTVLNA